MKKTICYLKQGMSVYAATYKGECGRKRGGDYVTLRVERVTCPKCATLINNK